MQVVKPNDIEDALRLDVGAILTASGIDAVCVAPPVPDDLAADTVCFTSTGGRGVSAVAYSHGVSVDCWASTEADAIALANAVCGIVGALPWFETANAYPYAECDMPYLNPDPYRPTLPRATFNANVTMRGESITGMFPE